MQRIRWRSGGGRGLVAALVLLAAGCAQPVTSAAAGGDVRGEIEVGGRGRSYFVHLPPGAGSRPLPLVVVLHGGGGDMAGAAKQTGFSAEADRSGFIAVYPNGSGILGGRLLTWNAGSCCSYAVKHGIDDVGFVRALVRELQTKYAIDPKRIYATGLSNGGMMSYRLACEASDVFAAVAPVSATLTYHDCAPAQPVSILHIHGSADEYVPLRGGLGTQSIDDDNTRPPVAYTIRFWVRANGTATTPQTTQSGNVRRDVYRGGRDGSEVQYWLINGAGHSWPGGERMLQLLDAPSTDLDATPAIWKFFATHAKP